MPRLAKALEEAQQGQLHQHVAIVLRNMFCPAGAVHPRDLDKMQQCFEQLMAVQRAALGLLEAIQSGSIRHLGKWQLCNRS